jgi:rubrerythrin
MSVFDFAMKMEIDGKAYYEKLARQTSLVGLRTIFTRLAEDEQTHYEIFRALQAGSKAPALPQSTALADAQNVFAELLSGAIAPVGSKDDLEAYRHAMQLEADSFRLYEDAAAKETAPDVRSLLLKIAGEEHKHFNTGLGRIQQPRGIPAVRAGCRRLNRPLSRRGGTRGRFPTAQTMTLPQRSGRPMAARCAVQNVCC